MARDSLLLMSRARRWFDRILLGGMLAVALIELCLLLPGLRARPAGDGAIERWLCVLLPALWLLLLGGVLLAPRARTWGALLLAASSLLTAPVLSEPLFGRDLYPLFVRYHLIMLVLALVLAARGPVTRLCERLLARHKGRGAPSIPEPLRRNEGPDAASRGGAPDPAPESPSPLLWQALNEAGYFFLGPGGAAVQRLDSPGLLSSLSLLGVTQLFWQYTHRNLVLFQLEGTEYVYLPPKSDGSLDVLPQHALLERVPVRAWLRRSTERSLQDRYACCFALQDSAQRYEQLAAERRAALDDFGPEIDLAPQLHRELCRIVASRDPLAIASALTLLHLLAVFKGHASEELRPPSVLFGDEAVCLLAEHLGTVHEGIRGPLIESAPGAAGSPRRISALTRKEQKTDGTAGGSCAQLALITLTLADEGWRFERAVLWSHTREGIELS